MPKISIYITHGFHASADNRTHIHLGTIDKNLLEAEEWISSSKKQKSTNKKKTASNITTTTNNISIFPNPTNGIFTIKNLYLFEEEGQSSIFITDITGKTIYSLSNISGNIIEINISQAKPGIYFLRLQSKETIKILKIIKN